MANLIRSILVVVAFLAMIAVAVFEWMEIEEYEIKDDMIARIQDLFTPAPEPAASQEQTPDPAMGEESMPGAEANAEGSCDEESDSEEDEESSDDSEEEEE
jgi:hypothetical protein